MTNCPDCGGRLRLHVANRLASTRVYRCEDCTARIEVPNTPPKETPS